MNSPTETDLITQIENLRVPAGQLALWSLGQAGFVIKGGTTIAYIDPFLSNARGHARRFPIPIDPGNIRHADVVFATHEHTDHADAGTLSPLLFASPQATLVTSPQGRKTALQEGISADRIVVPRIGQRVADGALIYAAVPAAHYEYELDDAGHASSMGFIIECNGVTLYHAGDTILVPEMLAALAGERIDLALLPINGRDFFRERQNIIGNLWPGEAVDLATAIKAKVLIGTHNDMFDYNRVNPGLLFDELDRRAPRQRCHLLQPCELYLYAG